MMEGGGWRWEKRNHGLKGEGGGRSLRVQGDMLWVYEEVRKRE